MDSSVNTRRSAFENYSSSARSLSVSFVPVTSGVAELADLAKKNSQVKKSMATYGWHQGHKVFATDNTSGLRQVANAGSMTYRSLHWRTCVVRGSEVAQVMSCPFPIKEDDFQASLHVPSYDGWLYGRLMCPRQHGSDYLLGSKVIKEPPVYRVSQYLTILNDLVTEMLIPNPDIKQIATTYYQVRDSLGNLVDSPDYRSWALLPGQTVMNVAHKLATYLRDRDGAAAVAREFVDYVNKLPPKVFFQAMQLIATDQVILLDRENHALPSSNLFHHSVFFDGDLVYASRHLTDNSTDHNTDDLTRYWIKRNLQEALKHIPTITLDHVTSMDDAIETIHRQAGKQVESKLRHVYLQKLVQDEILSQPRLSQESIKEMLPNLLALARDTKGITSLMMAILPDMAEIPNLNQSLAELLLRAAGGGENKKKLIIPIESLRQALLPEQLTSLVQGNIDRLNKHQSSILSAPGASARIANPQGSVLQSFIDEFHHGVTAQWQNEAMDIDNPVSSISDGDFEPLTQQPTEKTRQYQSLLRGSSGNNVLIKQLFDHIARLTINRNFVELTTLIEELHDREVDDKRRLISARTACRLVGRLLQHHLALHQIDEETVKPVFDQFRSILPTIDCYLSVDAIRHHSLGRRYISQILRALFQPRTAIDNHRSDDLEPIEFFTLPECIARQQTRNHNLQEVRNNRQYDCSICLESAVIPRLLNHNTAPPGQPENNGHPGMPICKPCVEQILKILPRRCPACRAPITAKDYVAFRPDSPGTP